MFKSYFTILTLLLCLAFTANAGNESKKKLKTFSVSGKVIDNAGALTGVKVTLNNKEHIVYTDFDGNFTIKNVKEGINNITFSMVTYGTKSVTINPTQTNSLEVKLYGK